MAVCVSKGTQAAIFISFNCKDKKHVSTSQKNTTLSGEFLRPGL